MSDLNVDLKKKLLDLYNNKRFSEIEFELELLGDLEKQSSSIMMTYAVAKTLNLKSKKKDYEKYNALFDTAQIELTRIKLRMDSDFPNVNEDKLILLKSFADALFNYIQILKRINYGLSLKATRRGEYTYRTYKKDLQSLDSARNIIADRQDAIFK